MQTAFDFEPGLTARFPKIRDLLTAVVYGSRARLQGVAADLDLSPSELSRMLSRETEDPRKLDVDDFVRIVESTGDHRPVQWLIEKFLRDPDQRRAEAAEQLVRLLPMLAELATQAGIADAAPRKGRR